VNEEIVHGIPSEKRVLKAGDIVSIDCGVVLDGYYGDAAITVPVGNGSEAGVTEAAGSHRSVALRGIEQARVGNSIGDVGCGRAGTCGSRRIQRGTRVCGTRHRYEAA
jgi:methionyl aminopeptidase